MPLNCFSVRIAFSKLTGLPIWIALASVFCAWIGSKLSKLFRYER